MKPALRIGGSVAVSAGILWLVFREAGTPAQEVARALATMGAGTWAAYLLAQLVQGWLRAVRYRVLLAGAGVAPLPPPGRMFGVALARNMFVDLLPARAGELMYWALLNRGEGVAHKDCMSSMAISILFDFLALAAVLAGAVAAPLLGPGGRIQLLWGAGVVLAVVMVGWLVLFHGPHLAVRGVQALPAGFRRRRPMARLEGFMSQLQESFGQVRAAGVLRRAAGLSVAIRAVKYLGLAAAFYGVARVMRPALAALPFWQTLVGLIGGEGGAALPVPTFLGLGAYEAAGAGAMRLAGVDSAAAALVLLGTHVTSQIVDYSLGGLGLLGLIWSGCRPAAAAPAARQAGRANALLVAGSFLAGGLLLLAALWYLRQEAKAGAAAAPGAGKVLAIGPHEMGALDAVWGNRSGFVVWSSTMYGQHDLIKMSWPEGDLVRLTRNPAVDSMPKISPDGKSVAFMRSRQEWVSFRNWGEWDIWLLELKTRKATRLAEHGTQPSWTGDGKAVVFQRSGNQVVQVDLATGQERVLLGARPHLAWTDPSLDPAGGKRLAVTVRGKRRNTSLFPLPTGKEKRVAGGCQLAFVPDGKWLVLVEGGGQMKNRICRVDREGRNLQTLIDMPLPWSHEYFPRVSNTGDLLVFGAAREGHEHDTADYEIFLWRLGTPPAQAARLSFHTGNDQWPDVWVKPPPPAKAKKSRSK